MTAGAARLCGSCGRIRPISKRAGADGPDICAGCYRPPTATCSGCGRLRPCTGIAAGQPLCSRCRPRAEHPCAHCGHSRPPAARWPEGPVCDSCYTAALRRIGTCQECGRSRRLVAPPGPEATTCAACSGTGPAGHVCTGCGREDKLYERGLCSHCALTRRTDALLAGPDGLVPDPLAGVRAAIIGAPQPRTALNWLRQGAAAPLLTALAQGLIPLSHAGLDAQPAGRAVDYLRALLVAHGALPGRDEPLARLERRITATLAGIDDAEDRRILTEYATWRVLHHVRYRASRRPVARTATRNAVLSMEAAVALLSWLGAHGIPLAQLQQAAVDQWLLTGPPHLAHHAADFLTWAAARGAAARLSITRPATAAGPSTGQGEHHALVHTLLNEPGIDTIDRVTGCLNLLYGQQLSRIAVMTTAQVHEHGDTLTLRIGRGDITIDEPLAGHLRDHLASPRRHRSIGAPDTTAWLFPGHIPGRPITASALGTRLRPLGINAQAGRRAAMEHLAGYVPAAVLADLLGIATTTAVDWAHASGGDWNRYAADTAQRLPNTHRVTPAT